MSPWSEVLEFWFGAEQNDALVAREKSALWWSHQPGVDAAIRVRFGALVAAAASGQLNAWTQSVEGRLALILLTDQLPRNIYRNTPAAFGTDAAALQLCLQGLANHEHQLLRPIHRVFLYLPLEHAESLDHQRQSVALFKALADDVSPELRPLFTQYVEFALGHCAIIERFGRFPHRNQVLGRQSSAAELEFLKQPNSSY